MLAGELGLVTFAVAARAAGAIAQLYVQTTTQMFLFQLLQNHVCLAIILRLFMFWSRFKKLALHINRLRPSKYGQYMTEVLLDNKGS